MRPAAILEAALYVPDLVAAEAFYGGLLGLPVIGRVPGRHVFFRVGAAVLLVFDPAATERPPSGPLPVPPHGARGAGHLCFAASRAEMDEWKRRLTAAGISGGRLVNEYARVWQSHALTRSTRRQQNCCSRSGLT